MALVGGLTSQVLSDDAHVWSVISVVSNHAQALDDENILRCNLLPTSRALVIKILRVDVARTAVIRSQSLVGLGLQWTGAGLAGHVLCEVRGSTADHAVDTRLGEGS